MSTLASSSRRTVPAWLDSIGHPIARWPDSLRIGTCCIVFAPGEERVLIAQRTDNGYWGFPGGAMEIGESVLGCIQRELQEETGLHLDSLRLIGIYSDPALYACNQYPDGNLIQYCCLCFRCTLTYRQWAQPLRGSAESHELRWVVWRSLPEPFLPGHRLRLEHALRAQTVLLR